MTNLIGAIPVDEVRYIYRKLGNLEAQVEATAKAGVITHAHSVETRAMLQEHAQAVRVSNEINDSRWAVVEAQLEVVQSVQDIQRVMSTIGTAITKGAHVLKSVAIIGTVVGVVWYAVKSGDFETALTGIKLLIGS